jgi:hypothetical protein
VTGHPRVGGVKRHSAIFLKAVEQTLFTALAFIKRYLGLGERFGLRTIKAVSN